MRIQLLVLMSLLVGSPSFAGPPSPGMRQHGPDAKSLPLAPPCQPRAAERTVWPNGSLLWGSVWPNGSLLSGSSRQGDTDGERTVLASVALHGARVRGTDVSDVRLEEGRLVSPSLASKGWTGVEFDGLTSDGQPVKVAVCGVESSRTETSSQWYRIEVRKEKSATWENPCIPTERTPNPRALAVQGVWDVSGARKEMKDRFTFACENGAIAKCAEWGYKPWAKKGENSLAPFHQACTRMVRGDYCGNGRSHTHDDNPLDVYDSLRIMTRTDEDGPGWKRTLASFEGGWTPDGASCLARTREGQSLKSIQEECPDRFVDDAKDFGDGDRCVISVPSKAGEKTLLRNWSYDKAKQAMNRPR